MVKHVNQKEFEEVVKDGVVVVDFFATWCGPCKMLSPVLEELSEEEANVKFVKVDIDEEELLAEQYNIQAVPTVLVFKDGKVVNKNLGFAPKAVLKNLLK